jgi:hypothetical protein
VFSALYTRKFHDEYVLCFCFPLYTPQLSTPSLFAPWVALDALQWRPLRQPRLDAMPWYNTLFSFGVNDDDDNNNNGDGGDDTDAVLVPRLVARCVVPVVCDVAAGDFDAAATGT